MLKLETKIKDIKNGSGLERVPDGQPVLLILAYPIQAQAPE